MWPVVVDRYDGFGVGDVRKAAMHALVLPICFRQRARLWCAVAKLGSISVAFFSALTASDICVWRGRVVKCVVQGEGRYAGSF